MGGTIAFRRLRPRPGRTRPRPCPAAHAPVPRRRARARHGPRAVTDAKTWVERSRAGRRMAAASRSRRRSVRRGSSSRCGTPGRRRSVEAPMARAHPPHRLALRRGGSSRSLGAPVRRRRPGQPAPRQLTDGDWGVDGHRRGTRRRDDRVHGRPPARRRTCDPGRRSGRSTRSRRLRGDERRRSRGELLALGGKVGPRGVVAGRPLARGRRRRRRGRARRSAARRSSSARRTATAPIRRLAPDLDRHDRPLERHRPERLDERRAGRRRSGVDRPIAVAFVSDRGRTAPWRVPGRSGDRRGGRTRRRLAVAGADADLAGWSTCGSVAMAGSRRSASLPRAGARSSMTVVERWRVRAAHPADDDRLDAGSAAHVVPEMRPALDARVTAGRSRHGSPRRPAPAARPCRPSSMSTAVRSGRGRPRRRSRCCSSSRRGYRVVLPNIRGSATYGRAWIRPQLGDWGGVDAADVHAALDHADRGRARRPGAARRPGPVVRRLHGPLADRDVGSVRRGGLGERRREPGLAPGPTPTPASSTAGRRSSATRSRRRASRSCGASRRCVTSRTSGRRC